MRGHDLVSIPGFKGRYQRGHPETFPPDHATDEKNCQFTATGIRSRDGLSTFLDTGLSGHILRVHALYFHPRAVPIVPPSGDLGWRLPVSISAVNDNAHGGFNTAPQSCVTGTHDIHKVNDVQGIYFDGGVLFSDAAQGHLRAKWTDATGPNLAEVRFTFETTGTFTAISAVKLFVRAWRSGGSYTGAEFRPFLYISGTHYYQDPATWEIAPAGGDIDGQWVKAPFGGPHDDDQHFVGTNYQINFGATNPATGLTWTQSDINGMEAGIFAKNDDPTLSTGPFLGTITLGVVATPPAPSPTPSTLSEEQTHLLILMSDGKLYDSALGFTTPIWTWTNADAIDFSVLTLFDRAYISPHNRQNGAEFDNLLVYDPIAGDTVAREAMGPAPTDIITSISEVNAGNIDAGQYVICTAFEYASGYISPPTIAVHRNLGTASGAHSFTLTGIPTGGTGVIGRHILSSKVFPAITGNIDDFELFFVPNGNIRDNTTTTLIINYFSSQLVDSAEYLKTLQTSMKGFLAMREYNGRMLGWGQKDGKNIIWASDAGKPEQFDTTSSFITLIQDAGGNVRQCVPLRGQLIIHKERQSLFTRDNDDTPSSWQILDLDASIGTEVYGVGEIITGSGGVADAYIIASRAGLYSFTGQFQQPALTFKVDDLWLNTINNDLFDRIQVKVDPDNKHIYVMYCVGVNVFCLFGDYVNGLSPQSIRWSLWSFPAQTDLVDIIQVVIPLTVVVNAATTTNDAKVLISHTDVVKIGRVGGNDDLSASGVTFSAVSDYGAPPDWLYKAAYVGDEGISHLAGTRSRIYSPLNLGYPQKAHVKILGQEDTDSFALADYITAVGDGNRNNIEKQRLANVKESKMAFQLTPGDPFEAAPNNLLGGFSQEQATDDPASEVSLFRGGFWSDNTLPTSLVNFAIINDYIYYSKYYDTPSQTIDFYRVLISSIPSTSPDLVFTVDLGVGVTAQQASPPVWFENKLFFVISIPDNSEFRLYSWDEFDPDNDNITLEEDINDVSSIFTRLFITHDNKLFYGAADDTQSRQVNQFNFGFITWPSSSFVAIHDVVVFKGKTNIFGYDGLPVIMQWDGTSLNIMYHGDTGNNFGGACVYNNVMYFTRLNNSNHLVICSCSDGFNVVDIAEVRTDAIANFADAFIHCLCVKDGVLYILNITGGGGGG